MLSTEHLNLLLEGVTYWNSWRAKSHKEPLLEKADLSGLRLSNVDLSYANLTGANLEGTKLQYADLSYSSLQYANLTNACLHGANLKSANLTGAYLVNAELNGVDLTWANLSNADLSNSILEHATFHGTIFNHANLRGASFKSYVSWALFNDTDLSNTKDLEMCRHLSPSAIDFQTLIKSGVLPRSFLEGCGLPDTLIEFLPSLLNDPIEFHSCFISYSHKDERFARRLYSRMREANLRVWYAPEDIKSGQKLHEQIDRAIQIHDKLLIVLSKNSLNSEWVITEIRKARKNEIKENRRKLFPIRLVDFEFIKSWECFDAESGKDLAIELREYFIPDFSNWKDADSFERAFNKLYEDLRATEKGL